MLHEKNKTNAPFCCSIQHKSFPRGLVKYTTDKDFSCSQFNKCKINQRGT